jgi:hypothetical protein
MMSERSTLRQRLRESGKGDLRSIRVRGRETRAQREIAVNMVDPPAYPHRTIPELGRRTVSQYPTTS